MTSEKDKRRDELIARLSTLSTLSTDDLELIARLAERIASPHACDRTAPPQKVVYESTDPPVTGIYPTCSTCGSPQVFAAREAIVERRLPGAGSALHSDAAECGACIDATGRDREALLLCLADRD